jgi:hypothetical protein
VEAVLRLSTIAMSLLIWFASNGQAFSQLVVKEFFVTRFPFGSIALVAQGSDIKTSKNVLVLQPNSAVEFERRRSCRVLVLHFDRERSGKRSFVGVQVLKLYKKGMAAPAVHVRRNSGLATKDGKSLPELEWMGINGSLTDFATKHASLEGLEKLLFYSGAPASSWHGYLKRETGEFVYTANNEHRVFWSAPEEYKKLEDLIQPYASQEVVVRAEHHLIGFSITDSTNAHNVPSFEIQCSDSNVLAIAVRIYILDSTEPSYWHLVTLK